MEIIMSTNISVITYNNNNKIDNEKGFAPILFS